MKDRVPAVAFPPGEFLKDELDEREWTQEEFAAIIGRPTTLVNQIVLGKRAITPESAAEIGAALGMDAEYWLNLETAYRLWLVRQKQETPALERISRMAQLRERFAVREMAKRGWITLERDSKPEDVERQILSLAGAKRLEDIASLAHAAKQTYYGRELKPTQQAWLWRVRQMADAMRMKRAYSEPALRACLDKLRQLAAEVDHVAHVPALLAEAGVRFLIVEGLPGAAIDGVTMWLNAKSPVIALTLRFDRLDNFWFVLRHEIEHVLRNEGHEQAIVDIGIGPGAESSTDSLPRQEKIANEAAAEYFIPQRQFSSFLRDLVASYSEQKVIDFASELRVHPAIVVGQIHKHLQRYDILRKFLTRVRPVITEAALTDGFGRVFRLSV
jgi:HTH-type transcriptional regulator / antitoxin HigA